MAEAVVETLPLVGTAGGAFSRGAGLLTRLCTIWVVYNGQSLLWRPVDDRVELTALLRERNVLKSQRDARNAHPFVENPSHIAGIINCIRVGMEDLCSLQSKSTFSPKLLRATAQQVREKQKARGEEVKRQSTEASSSPHAQ